MVPASPLVPGQPQGGAPRSGRQPQGGAPAFGQLFESALRDPSRSAEPGWILASGELAPQVLCRYAAGVVTPSERSGVQELVVRHDWARGCVVKLVQAGRPDAPARSVGRALLEAARGGSVDPYRVVALLALREQGLEEAAQAAEAGNRAGLARLELAGPLEALGALALGEDPAGLREGLAALEGAGPASSLVSRVVERSDADEALVELLAAL